MYLFFFSQPWTKAAASRIKTISVPHCAKQAKWLLPSSSSPKHGAETGLCSQARILISAGPQRVPEKLHGTDGRKEDEHSQSV